MAQPSPLHTSAASGADHLRLEGISRSFPDRSVLTDVSFTVSSGEIAALIGENGSGKSTLLAVLAGQLEADDGAITRPDRLRVALLSQEPLGRPAAQTVRTAYAAALGLDRSAHGAGAARVAFAIGDTDIPPGW